MTAYVKIYMLNVNYSLIDIKFKVISTKYKPKITLKVVDLKLLKCT